MKVLSSVALPLGWFVGLGLLAGCGTSSASNRAEPDAEPATFDDAAAVTDALPGPEGGPGSSSDAAGTHPRGHVAYVVEDVQTAGSVVYVAPLDGSSAPIAVTSLTGAANTGKFSRDGRSVYYVHQLSSGTEIRSVGADGTNDRLVYGTCPFFCYALGEDATGRVLVWNQTGASYTVGVLDVVTPGDGGAPALAPWAGDPGCSADANLDVAGDTIVFTAGCPTEHVFVGPSAAGAPFAGLALTGVQVMLATEHVQLGGDRIFLRGWPLGTDAGAPGSAVHVMSMAKDGTDVQDLDVGDDAQDFVISDDAGFVLVSHEAPAPEAGAAPVSSIVAHVGASRIPIPGLQAIPSRGIVTIGWTPN